MVLTLWPRYLEDTVLTLVGGLLGKTGSIEIGRKLCKLEVI